MSKEAMKLVLKALEAADWYINQLEITLYSADDAGTHEDRLKVQQAITVMRLEIDALNMASKPALEEQPAQQEPVGYVAENGLVDWNVCAPPMMTDLYASPPAQRKPLTDEEVDRLWSQSMADTAGETYLPLREFARAIEAAHGLKENT
jgi:hypothetical protein